MKTIRGIKNAALSGYVCGKIHGQGSATKKANTFVCQARALRPSIGLIESMREAIIKGDGISIVTETDDIAIAALDLGMWCDFSNNKEIAVKWWTDGLIDRILLTANKSLQLSPQEEIDARRFFKSFREERVRRNRFTC